MQRIAVAWTELMTALGYERFGAQGGDWGSAITTELGASHADRVVGIHLNMVSAGPGKDRDDLTEAEQASLARMEEHRRWGMGYSTQQSTRPQTLGYGLVDSPSAQAAWVVEKFWAWADHQGHPEDAVSRDRLLDNVMHYWLPAAGASSARLYWESFNVFGAGSTIDVPSGMSIFPKEIFAPSRRWAERRFTDIRHWNELDAGGHFAAFERPAVFVDEVRTAFQYDALSAPAGRSRAQVRRRLGAGGADGRPLDEPGPLEHRERRIGGTGDAVFEQREGEPAHRRPVDTDGGQRRVGEVGGVDVVEADDREIRVGPRRPPPASPPAPPARPRRCRTAPR